MEIIQLPHFNWPVFRYLCLWFADPAKAGTPGLDNYLRANGNPVH